MLCETDDILNETISFYTELYTAESTDEYAQSMFSNISNRLSNEKSAMCEGYISFDEATKAIKSFAHDKSPGIDGLTAEWYNCFWDTIGPDLG